MPESAPPQDQDRQPDTAALAERLLVVADELERQAEGHSSTAYGGGWAAQRRQAALIRALVAEHEPEQYGSEGPLGCMTCIADGEWPCTTLTALAACFLPADRSA